VTSKKILVKAGGGLEGTQREWGAARKTYTGNRKKVRAKNDIGVEFDGGWQGKPINVRGGRVKQCVSGEA